jgi:hypothetical protein
MSTLRLTCKYVCLHVFMVAVHVAHHGGHAHARVDFASRKARNVIGPLAKVGGGCGSPFGNGSAEPIDCGDTTMSSGLAAEGARADAMSRFSRNETQQSFSLRATRPQVAARDWGLAWRLGSCHMKYTIRQYSIHIPISYFAKVLQLPSLSPSRSPDHE